MKKEKNDKIYSEPLYIKLSPEEKDYLKKMSDKMELSMSSFVRNLIISELNGEAAKSSMKILNAIRKDVNSLCNELKSSHEGLKASLNILNLIVNDKTMKMSANFAKDLYSGFANELVTLNDGLKEVASKLSRINDAKLVYNLNPIYMQKLTIFGVITSPVRKFKSKSGNDMLSFQVTAKGSNNIKGIADKETVFNVYSSKVSIESKIIPGETIVVVGNFDFKESVTKLGEKTVSLNLYAEEIESSAFYSEQLKSEKTQ